MTSRRIAGESNAIDREVARLQGSERKLRRNRLAVVGTALLALALLAPQAAAAPPLTLTYDLFSLGLPIMTLEFRLTETADAYRVTGQVHSNGVADFFSRYVLHTESKGKRSEDGLHPQAYSSDSHSRLRQRAAHLDYAADGSIATALDPPEDPAQTPPTAQQIAGSLDPVSGILQAAHALARAERCAMRIPIFDGRRRYDLVFIDAGSDTIPASEDGAFAGEARRCAIDIIKIAGFSSDADRFADKVDHGTVWLAAPRTGAPPLPVRLEFTGNLGAMRLQLVAVDRTP